MNAYTRHFVVASLAILSLSPSDAGDWPRFRGPNGSGFAPDKVQVPTDWNETKNRKWKIELPGPGHSSPIVIGEQVLVTYWTGYGIDPNELGDQKNLRIHLVSVDRRNGKTLWSQEIEPELPQLESKGTTTPRGYACHTPVSDGQQIFAFLGSTGVIAFDMKGKKLWQSNVGTELEDRGWGSASSPILYKNLVIITASVEAETLVALDKETGEEVWKQTGKDLTNTWGTPALVTANDRTDLVLSVPYNLLGIDPDTGERLWNSDGSQDNTACSSVIVHDDVTYLIGGRAGGTVAVRAGGMGDVTQSHGLWESGRSGLTASPIYHEGRLHWINRGTAYCIDATTGRRVYQSMIPPGKGSESYASPVASGDKMYQLRKDGEMVVIQLGPKYQETGRNMFEGGGEFDATPAISNGDLFVRSTKHLYCVAKIEPLPED